MLHVECRAAGTSTGEASRYWEIFVWDWKTKDLASALWLELLPFVYFISGA